MGQAASLAHAFRRYEIRGTNVGQPSGEGQARWRYAAAKTLSAIAIIAMLMAYNAWATDAARSDAEAREQIAEATRASATGPYAADGVFTGSAEGYGGTVTMQVTIENGWIAACEILDASHEDQAWLDMAIVLPERIVEAQTPNIDVVSGATFTSTGILNGVTEALQQSMAGGIPDEEQ